jgi:hypothetical protein
VKAVLQIYKKGSTFVGGVAKLRGCISATHPAVPSLVPIIREILYA